MLAFDKKLNLSLLILIILALIVSGLNPFDRTTWLLEVFPVLIVLPILTITRNSYPLTRLLYSLIFLHCLVLILGGAYSYARVPLGFWLQDWFELSRNPYDKIGHFMQGFVPVMAAREILIKGNYINGKKMLAFICLCVVLAISACYELIEWAAAVALRQGADEFLGTQGDPWDTQSDILFALIGGITALIGLSRLHDKQLNVSS